MIPAVQGQQSVEISTSVSNAFDSQAGMDRSSLPPTFQSTACSFLANQVRAKRLSKPADNKEIFIYQNHMMKVNKTKLRLI